MLFKPAKAHRFVILLQHNYRFVKRVKRRAQQNEGNLYAWEQNAPTGIKY